MSAGSLICHLLEDVAVAAATLPGKAYQGYGKGHQALGQVSALRIFRTDVLPSREWLVVPAPRALLLERPVD